MVESAYTFDMSAQAAEVAGFLTTRGALHIKATDEALVVNVLLDSIEGVAQTTPRTSGANTISLDGFDTVLSTTIEVNTNLPTTVTELRAKLLPKLLNRPVTDVSLPPYPWTGAPDTAPGIRPTIWNTYDGTLPNDDRVRKRLEPYQRPPFNATVRATCFPKGSDAAKAEPAK